MTVKRKCKAAAGLTALAAGAWAMTAFGAPAAHAQVTVATGQYTWRNVVIGGGGFVPGIIFSPAQRDLLYARTDIGGAYRWDPANKRWMPLNDMFGAEDWNLYGAESIAPDPNDPNRVYMAAGTYTNSWAGNGAILRSDDKGQTWQRTDLPFKLGGNEDGRSIGERLDVDPNDGHVIYFGTRHNGLWRSADYGATWNPVRNFPVGDTPNGAGIGFVIFDKSSGAAGSATPTIYVGIAALGTTLYRTTDGGNTWLKVAKEPPDFLLHHGVMTNDGTLYLTYSNGPGPNGVSDGAVWKLNTHNGQWTDITPVKAGAPNHSGYAGLAVDASNPNVVMVSTLDRWGGPGDDIYRSTDGGSTWNGIAAHSTRDSSAAPYLKWGQSSPKFGWWIGDVAMDPFDSSHVLYGTGATIWGSDDVAAVDTGGTAHWTPRTDGLEETADIDIISPPEGPPLISALGDLGGFRHDDLNASPRRGMFSPIYSNTRSIDFADQVPLTVVRVGSPSDRTAKHGAISEDGGGSWRAFATEPAGAAGEGNIAISADGSTIVWSPGSEFPAFSRDKGATWTICTGVPGNVSIVADRGNPDKFYARDNNSGQLFMSSDGGATFEARISNLAAKQGRMKAAPGREGVLWVAGKDDGLFRSTDSAGHFSKIANVQSAKAVGFGRSAPGQTTDTVYIVGKVGGQSGIFRSTNNGSSWTRINDDLHGFGTAEQITGDPRIYGRVYIGTNGRGIFYGDPATSG